MATSSNGPRSASSVVRRPRLHEDDIDVLLNSLANGDISDCDDNSDSGDEWQAHQYDLEETEINEGRDSDSSEDDLPLSSIAKTGSAKNKKKKPVQIWKTGGYTPPSDLDWKGKPFTDDGTEIGTPYQYFVQYIPEHMYDTMAKETNIYSHKTNGVSVNTDSNEMRRLTAMHIVMGILGFPRLRMYWNPLTKIPAIVESMSRNRYSRLRQNLHVVNEQPNNTDRLWKVRPVIDCVLKRCCELIMEQNMCIDEQIIPFKGHHSLKQYVKNKPNPWGFKAYLLCGESGLVYNFIMYEGKTTPLVSDFVEKYGATGATVIKLAERIPGDENYKLYADNFFSGIPLIRCLKEQGIFYAGTIRKNRTVGCPIRNLVKEKRGTMEEHVTAEKDVVLTTWRDNKDVNMVSTFVGEGKCDEVKRWCKVTKQYVMVRRPEVIACYNKSMGGVDKTDFLIQLYRIFVRSRKWTLRVLFHFVTLSVTNSWLEYRREASVKGQSKKTTLDLLDFTMSLAETLCKAGLTIEKKRGRPSNGTPSPIPTKRKSTTEVRPNTDVRNDHVDHWPLMIVKRGRCKMEGCKGFSRVFL